MRHLQTILLCLLCLTRLDAQTLLHQADPKEKESWVDEQMRRLDTPEKRLGQLIMPMISDKNGSADNSNNRQLIDDEITRYHVGGVVLSRTTIHDHATLTNYAQQQAYDADLPPLLVGIDAEWGLAMRMSDAVRFPRNGAVGSIKNVLLRDTICTLYGQELARECRLMGIHINFGPVLDINTNKANPVIGTRAYGSTVYTVSRCGTAFARALEAGGVLSCAKHFPGHGDTSTDSHKVLPLLGYSLEQLQERELAPFQQYIDCGLGGVMTAHLNLPKVAEQVDMPSSVSHRIVTGLLREQMGFDGLVITDGLAMKGACDYPDVCVEALLAGNDILLQPTPAAAQWESLLKALRDGRLPQALIDEKCRRVLRWKYTLICHPLPADGVTLSPYPRVDTVGLVSRVVTDEAKRLGREIQRLSTAPEDASIDPTLQTAFAQLDAPDVPAEPIVPQRTMRRAAPSPVARQDHSLVARDHSLVSLYTPPIPQLRLPVASAEEVGMSSMKLAEVARLAEEVVTSDASPGCQVLVARHGKVVFDQSYGLLGGTFAQNPFASQTVTPATMYDLASVTKAVATVPAVMLLMQEHGIRLRDRITRWLPELEGTPYAQVTLQDLLYHESGLAAGFAFHTLTAQPDTTFRSDTMIQAIASLPPRRRQGSYLYSCLNFVLLRHIIERVSGEQLDRYLERRLPDFFGPWLCFNPQQHGVANAFLAPTEQDDAIRQRFIHGTVHDEIGAWALGVEGNSGLFGSAEALAPLLQMMLCDGRLGDRQYLPHDICHQFTTLTSVHSRRGLGFDKPETDPRRAPNNSCAPECSRLTWGHTGFTGTCFWVDPQEDLIFIFLSNRICPSRQNRRLLNEDYRTRIQSAIYASITQHSVGPIHTSPTVKAKAPAKGKAKRRR